MVTATHMDIHTVLLLLIKRKQRSAVGTEMQTKRQIRVKTTKTRKKMQTRKRTRKQMIRKLRKTKNQKKKIKK